MNHITAQGPAEYSDSKRPQAFCKSQFPQMTVVSHFSNFQEEKKSYLFSSQVVQLEYK